MAKHANVSNSHDLYAYWHTATRQQYVDATSTM